MKITFIGKSACIPAVGEEVNCLIINEKYLLDTGFYCALKMRELGFDPLKIETVFFTHIHHDHFIGLPGLLFYIAMKSVWEKREKTPSLSIVGPAGGIQKLVDNSKEFLQLEEHPVLKIDLNVVPIIPGNNYEDSEIYVETFPALHPVQSIVYKFREKKTGKSFTCSWDTSFHPPIAEFVRGEELLIHDAAHTLPREAATIAKMAQVKKLYLIHYLPGVAQQALKEAREIFPDTFLPEEGQTLEI